MADIFDDIPDDVLAPSKVAKKKNTASKAAAKASVEETYQRVTQREHVLLRPDTYIGTVEKTTKEMWVYDEDVGLNYRKVTYVPGLYKIFDEILVNAADNKVRDSTMSSIKIVIDCENALISVWNNGHGIPVVMHDKEKMYVPELIFGHLLTGSNYNDNEKKTTGGRNGYGAKLANILSTRFVVETSHKESGHKFKQVFRNNMADRDEPDVSPCTGSDYTKISFQPDLKYFKMDHLDKDMIAIMTRRAYDLAGVVGGVSVYVNGEKIKIKNFTDYVTMYLKTREEQTPVLHERVNDRWEVCVTSSSGDFSQVSFVNAIATTRGGTHVNMVVDQITDKLAALVKRKNKGQPVKSTQIKSHLWVFVNSLIENPAFDTQTKENMTLRAKAFGSDCSLSDKFLKGVVNSGIIQSIVEQAQQKAQAQLAKTCSGTKRVRITGLPKLDDANEAGGRNSEKCTLILTEGDSAKALAVSGLSVVGRDYYGVFPLRGKLLNVREASNKQIMDNAEVQAIVKIMGLQYTKKYESAKGLRYGHLMIMADQDNDGSHIKGLLINLIQHFWPSLLRVPGFLVEFATPIVKATKGKKAQTFFTLPEYNEWRDSDGNGGTGWRIKYYKGLGTSTAAEAKAYFSDMDAHQHAFQWTGPHDDDSVDMAFSKKRVEDRKGWLRDFRPGTFLDHSEGAITYSDFINKELVLFSLADNVRSIPSVVDGLKPALRKVLYGAFKRKLKEEIKVAQLAGYVAEHSAYHHGEQSLCSTIVNMAQTYVGANNVNLLQPIGQFGTRLQGGKDAASARYIFTSLAPITRLLFPTADDAILNYLDDDGQKIEPAFYAPVLPLVLVNGADGIGTGWSTSVPNFNPRDIAAQLLAMMDGAEAETLVPWWRGFAGTVSQLTPTRYSVTGIIEQIDDTTLVVSELPVGSWTQTYKEFLETLMAGTDKVPPFIKDFKEYHTDTTVRFVITLSEEKMAEALSTGLNKKFKIETTVSTTNMVLFDAQGCIRKYDTVQDVLSEFYAVRLRLYQERKGWLSDLLTEEWRRLDNKVRFVLAVVSGDLIIHNRKKAELLTELRSRGFDEMSTTQSKRRQVETETDEDGTVSSSSTTGLSYDYLLGMKLWSLTMEKVEELKHERDSKEAELNLLLQTSPTQLWRKDIEVFLDELEKYEEALRLAEEEGAKQARKGGKGGKARAIKKKKKSAESDDDDDDFMDEDEDDWAPKAKKKSSTTTTTTTTSTKSKAKATTVPTVKAVAAKKSTSVAVKATKMSIDDDDDDDDEPMSLADRIAARKAADTNTVSIKSTTAAAKKTAVVRPRSPTASPSVNDKLKAPETKRKRYNIDEIADALSELEFGNDDEENDDYVAPAKKATATKKATAAGSKKSKKKTVVVDSEEEDDDDDAVLLLGDDSDDDDAFQPTKKKSAPVKKAAASKAAPAPKKAAPVAKKTAAATKKSKVVEESSMSVFQSTTMKKKVAPKKSKKREDSDDDGDDDMFFLSDSEVVEAVTPAVKKRGRREIKQIKYTVEDDDEDDDEEEEEESEDDFEEDDDFDEDDF